MKSSRIFEDIDEEVDNRANLK